jgi:predicted PurR-regulated permease PerM
MAHVTAERWRIALWTAMLAVVLYIVWQARGALFPFAVGAILAYALSPLVDRMASVIPARSHRGDVYRRGAAVILLYTFSILAIVAAGAALIPVAADQIAQFVDDLPDTVEEARLQANEWLEEYRSRVPQDIQDRIDEIGADAGNTVADAVASGMRRSVSLLTGTLTIVFGFLIVPFFMFYALRDRPYVANNFINAVPEEARQDVRNLLLIADRLLGRYIRGQLILGVVVGVAVGVGLTLLDVELSLALGLFAGVTELIPIIGPWIGAVPGLIIVAATNPDLIIPVALLYLLVQQVENLLLVPRIQGQAVEIHPAMILLLLAAGGAAFGFIGLVVIVPLAAILRELFWYADRRLRGSSATEALTLSHYGRAHQRELEAQLAFERSTSRSWDGEALHEGESAEGTATGSAPESEAADATSAETEPTSQPSSTGQATGDASPGDTSPSQRPIS